MLQATWTSLSQELHTHAVSHSYLVYLFKKTAYHGNPCLHDRQLNLLGKTATKCHFLSTLYTQTFLPKGFPVTLLWSSGPCQKTAYEWKPCLILVMDAVGMGIASQNREVIDILTLILIPQKQHSDKTYLNWIIMHFMRMCFVNWWVVRYEDNRQRAKNNSSPVGITLCTLE